MNENPLEPARPDSEVKALFLRHFGLDEETPAPRLLEEVSRAFSRIPYENLTKILRFAESGNPGRARRAPREVITEYVSRGAGGTCFSLTATLLHILRALGWEAEPILADRKYGADTHCALIVQIGGVPHLLDPGYLVVRPLALGDSEERRVTTAFNEVILRPREGGEKVDLHTLQQGNRTYRLTFRTAPVDAGEFLRAWDASFDWEMMHYPVLTRVAGDRQLYLQDTRFQVRRLEDVSREALAASDVLSRIHREFGIGEEIARRALEILKRERALHGKSAGA